LAGGFAPTGVGIAGRHLPGGAGEEQAGQQCPGWLRGANEVAQLRADGYFVAEIVVAL